jgi:hypothetical protein
LPEAIGSRNWITPAAELETLFFPQPAWLIDAITHGTVNVVAQYADLFTGGQIGSTTGLRPATGAILRRGLTKIAAYRDEHGALHQFKAACPHLGCIVAGIALYRTREAKQRPAVVGLSLRNSPRVCNFCSHVQLLRRSWRSHPRVHSTPYVLTGWCETFTSRRPGHERIRRADRKKDR